MSAASVLRSLAKWRKYTELKTSRKTILKHVMESEKRNRQHRVFKYWKCFVLDLSWLRRIAERNALRRGILRFALNAKVIRSNVYGRTTKRRLKVLPITPESAMSHFPSYSSAVKCINGKLRTPNEVMRLLKLKQSISHWYRSHSASKKLKVVSRIVRRRHCLQVTRRTFNCWIMRMLREVLSIVTLFVLYLTIFSWLLSFFSDVKDIYIHVGLMEAIRNATSIAERS
jgi:hypothetical protein